MEQKKKERGQQGICGGDLLCTLLWGSRAACGCLRLSALHTWPIHLSGLKLSESSHAAPLPARPTGAAPQPRERSPRLQEVLFPPFPFPFKAPGKAVRFLSGLCRALKWGHSGSLINPVQLSLHPRLHIVLAPSPPPQCLLRQLNICLKTGCQEVVLAKPHFSLWLCVFSSSQYCITTLREKTEVPLALGINGKAS